MVFTMQDNVVIVINMDKLQFQAPFLIWEIYVYVSSNIYNKTITIS